MAGRRHGPDASASRSCHGRHRARAGAAAVPQTASGDEQAVRTADKAADTAGNKGVAGRGRNRRVGNEHDRDQASGWARPGPISALRPRGSRPPGQPWPDAVMASLMSPSSRRPVPGGSLLSGVVQNVRQVGRRAGLRSFCRASGGALRVCASPAACTFAHADLIRLQTRCPSETGGRPETRDGRQGRDAKMSAILVFVMPNIQFPEKKICRNCSMGQKPVRTRF